MNYNDTRRRFIARVDARALRMALKFHRWSYADLARAAGISKGTVGNLASGARTTANPETAAAIAKALNVDTDDLFMLEPLHVDSTQPIGVA